VEREPFVIATTERGGVASAPVRSRIQYELERIVGLPVASLEGRIEGARSR